MQLIVKPLEKQTQIEFNYDELKNWVTKKSSEYEGLVYTDETIKDAKKDRADLNRLSKALNDERIRLEKEWMEPFGDFKGKVDELIGIIKKPVEGIKKQIDEYEAAKKEAKRKEISDLFERINDLEWFKLEQIFDSKWLNVSTSMSAIEDRIKDAIGKAKKEIETAANIPKHGFEAAEMYKETLDLAAALREADRLAMLDKKKEEERRRREEREKEIAAKRGTAQVFSSQVPAKEAAKPEPVQEPVAKMPVEKPAAEPVTEDKTGDGTRQWIGFEALLTIEQAMKLKTFFTNEGIEFRKIGG